MIFMYVPLFNLIDQTLYTIFNQNKMTDTNLVAFYEYLIKLLLYQQENFINLKNIYQYIKYDISQEFPLHHQGIQNYFMLFSVKYI